MATRIEHAIAYGFRNNSGSFTRLAAIRRALARCTLGAASINLRAWKASTLLSYFAKAVKAPASRGCWTDTTTLQLLALSTGGTP
jgi:hypothetical protein